METLTKVEEYIKACDYAALQDLTSAELMKIGRRAPISAPTVRSKGLPKDDFAEKFLPLDRLKVGSNETVFPAR